MVQELFRTVHRNGYFVPKTTMSAISPSTGRTLPDRYIEGTCPICGYDGARGDQCDNCGNQLDPIDLINPQSRINGETPIFTESEHFSSTCRRSPAHWGPGCGPAPTGDPMCWVSVLRYLILILKVFCSLEQFHSNTLATFKFTF